VPAQGSEWRAWRDDSHTEPAPADVAAGRLADANGRFAEGTLFGRVDAKLQRLAEDVTRYGAADVDLVS
jgi:hypothetical protein